MFIPISSMPIRRQQRLRTLEPLLARRRKLDDAVVQFAFAQQFAKPFARVAGLCFHLLRYIRASLGSPSASISSFFAGCAGKRRSSNLSSAITSARTLIFAISSP
jgi:hypothetical protein